MKERTIRGGFAKMCSQAANFTLRIGSLMVLGRLLGAQGFRAGRHGDGRSSAFLTCFKDFGLSTATVQRLNVTEEQVSTLFWVNMLVGAVLAGITLAMAPMVAVFYHEPRLFAVTAVMTTAFLFNAAGVQHGAILQRELRFKAMATIEIVSLVAGIASAIGMALKGFGYWSLVAMAVVTPLAFTLGAWLVTRWVPGRPRRGSGIVSMLRFGGTVTLNGLIVYIAYNLEKVLLGRYWGAEAVGIYGRAYQLISIPTDNLNGAAGGVALAALSRVQDDAKRLKSYFLKGYSLALALTLPVTILCALMADDLILVILGPKWNGTATIFRLLAPTILIFALINPLAWLMISIGMVGRSLKVALVLAPIVISGYLVGLPYGPKGVALAYSAMMTLWVIPHILWCIHGTVVSFRDIVAAVVRPLLSGLTAALLPALLQFSYPHWLPPVIRLALGVGLFLGVYLTILLLVMGQKTFYLELLEGFRGRSAMGEKAMATT